MDSDAERSGQSRACLREEDTFSFRCHADLPCFTTCCRDVNIFLSPFDVLRMKKRLGISSGVFLERYTISLIPEVSGFPVVLLRMQEDRNKACPFVTPEGCSIYEDRPWPCRMFPLDQDDRPGSFRFITDAAFCLGMKEGKELGVREYLEGQKIGLYEESERLLSRIATHPRFSKARVQNPKIQEMCRMALYDLDRFRTFVLESRFLQIFEVEKDIAERISTDDLELMRLAFRWLEFGLIAGETLKMRADVVKGTGEEE